MPALPVKPTKCPTITWSMMPWTPPMMFVSIVGQASFQTAGTIGPSTIDRSYFRRCCVVDGGGTLTGMATDGAPEGGGATGRLAADSTAEAERGRLTRSIYRLRDN